MLLTRSQRTGKENLERGCPSLVQIIYPGFRTIL
jgi:hypothetical protein